MESEEKHEFKKSRSANLNKSTLSLHIEAYENSIDADTSDSDDGERENLKTTLIKKWETSKHGFNGFSSLIRNPYEFPRQQKDKNIEPEMMQFKASQRLRNPPTSVNKKKNKKSSSEAMSAREMSDCSTPILDGNNNHHNQMQFEVDAFQSNKHFSNMKIDAFVTQVLQRGVKGLLEDFTSIRIAALPEKEEISQWIAHPDLNRYKNILCWDKSRVILREHPDQRTYIHASIVGGPLYPDRFVCAQGPLPHTCYDFWLMIFEQNIMSVLQLCRFIEDNDKKCAVYYPEKKGETMQFRDIRILCADVKLLGTPGTVYQRIFSVYKGETMGKEVFHLSFETWPDHGVPTVDTTLLTILQKVRMSTNHPILIHCSAGIGRTGTVVAIENILESLMLGKNVEPHEIVAKLRTQRRQSVQREGVKLLGTPGTVYQ
uniref:Protein tyrosine phosphatase n=1 Tax=Panagrolaimus sp. ES5 TaxID=591445 RepID=A0AC34GUI7_9BILA